MPTTHHFQISQEIKIPTSGGHFTLRGFSCTFERVSEVYIPFIDEQTTEG